MEELLLSPEICVDDEIMLWSRKREGVVVGGG